MSYSVALLDDYQGVALQLAPWHQLEADGVRVRAFQDHLAGEEELAARLAPFDIVVAMRERTAFPLSLLERLPNLRLLVTTGMANESIDLAGAGQRGITVCGTAGSAAAAPELTWALLLALVRHVPSEDALLRSGGWQHSLGRELAGGVLGVLGLGRIGKRVARYAQAFDMKVLAWSPHLTEQAANEVGVKAVSKQELFELSDVVSIHLRLSERTRGIVGAEELRLLGPQGYLVNTSRGPIVEEPALLSALHNGLIGGAGLDVYGEEPLPVHNPFVQAPRTVLTPHLGYVTEQSYRTYYNEALEDVQAWLGGEPVRVLPPPVDRGAT
jgi:phosphoglycerate dehydrogenase-like enzyme